jgi:hypothetical protein
MPFIADDLHFGLLVPLAFCARQRPSAGPLR